MKNKISTMFFSVNNVEGNLGSIIDLDMLSDEQLSEFSEVFDMLNNAEAEPSKESVDRILEFCKSNNL